VGGWVGGWECPPHAAVLMSGSASSLSRLSPSRRDVYRDRGGGEGRSGEGGRGCWLCLLPTLGSLSHTGGLAVMDEAYSGPTRRGGPLADSSVETLGCAQTRRQGQGGRGKPASAHATLGAHQHIPSCTHIRIRLDSVNHSTDDTRHTGRSTHTHTRTHALCLQCYK